MSEYCPSKLRLNYSYYLAEFLRKRQNGFVGGQILTPRSPLSQGEGGKLERRWGANPHPPFLTYSPFRRLLPGRGGQAGKAMGGKSSPPVPPSPKERGQAGKERGQAGKERGQAGKAMGTSWKDDGGVLLLGYYSVDGVLVMFYYWVIIQ